MIPDLVRPFRARSRKLASALVALGLSLAFSGQLQAQATTYHVSKSGADSNPGTSAKPFRTVQKAVDVVKPSDTILVHAGTYQGDVRIRTSGASGKRITLRSAGDGPVVLTENFPVESCDRTAPTSRRTVKFLDGVDHWTLQDLTIVNGILISGTNFDNLTPYVEDHTLPGRGMYDPEAAKGTLASLGSNGADYIQILNNVIEGRGIYVWAARYGRIARNEIRNIACGTGGGIWLGRFSDGWSIRLNNIHDIEGSTRHYMSEGSRTAGGSMYNIIEYNVVERVTGIGRGISTDANASWNVLRRNTVKQTSIAFSEQHDNWGNTWSYNLAQNNRRYGFRVGPTRSTPVEETPRFLTMNCNQSVSDSIGLSIGSATESTWDSNDFRKVELLNFKPYWPEAQNIWEGSSKAPPSNPSNSNFLANC